MQRRGHTTALRKSTWQLSTMSWRGKHCCESPATHLHDAEGLCPRGIHGQRCHGDVRARLPVLLHEWGIVHPVQVVPCNNNGLSVPAASFPLLWCNLKRQPEKAVYCLRISWTVHMAQSSPERIRKSCTPVRVVFSNSHRYCRTASAVPCGRGQGAWLQGDRCRQNSKQHLTILPEGYIAAVGIYLEPGRGNRALRRCQHLDESLIAVAAHIRILQQHEAHEMSTRNLTCDGDAAAWHVGSHGTALAEQIPVQEAIGSALTYADARWRLSDAELNCVMQ